MLLLDVQNKCWSKEMLEICGISESQMPGLYESYEVVGTVLPEVAAALGIPASAKVVAGAGDNAAAAVGTGTVGEGKCNISLGTSGTVFIPSDNFSVDNNNALHSFCHSDGYYHLMGCILSAASCNKWFCENILKSKDIGAELSAINEEMLGENEIYFLPYLMGERSPINDTDARGVFLGLTPATKREDMLLAVIEGVSFAIRDNIEVARALGINIETSKLCGGGAKSTVWQKILAAILGITLEIPSTEEGPGYGGAILAMVGSGEYTSVKEAAEELAELKTIVVPDKTLVAKYEKKYQNYKKIYPALKSVFKEMRN
jgi:xylulokinase